IVLALISDSPRRQVSKRKDALVLTLGNQASLITPQIEDGKLPELLQLLVAHVSLNQEITVSALARVFQGRGILHGRPVAKKSRQLARQGVHFRVEYVVVLNTRRQQVHAHVVLRNRRGQQAAVIGIYIAPNRLHVYIARRKAVGHGAPFGTFHVL